MVVLSAALPACGPGLASLQSLARAGDVQRDAPRHARQDVVINAPVHRVWQCLANVAAWPTWNAAVRSSEAPSSVTGDAMFRWDNHGSDIHAQLGLVRQDHVLAWSDTASTAKAIHVWRLSEVSHDVTRVEVEETMDGFLVSTFYSGYELDQTLATWLFSLKSVAERAEEALRRQALAPVDGATLSTVDTRAVSACQ